MDQNRLSELGQKLKEGRASTEEYDELAEGIRADESGELAARLATILGQGAEPAGEFNDNKWQAVAENILSIDRPVVEPKPAHIVQMLKRLSVAAAIILLVGAGTYFLFFNQPALQVNKPAAVIEPPSSLNAMLTLANGEKIVLEGASNGILTVQGDRNVVLTGDQINYAEGETANNSEEVLYNTLTVPRGSKIISVILSDGTKVWLNSESSLRYPTSFSGAVRRVELAGEGYFEVSKNAAWPFLVSAGETNVKVLGTSFNVNAYENEPGSKVTLVEGSVQVSKNAVLKTLRPGQQADMAGEINVHSSFNMEEVLAWKNGRFSFNGADIQQVMRELARWYDLEVVYTKNIKEKFHVEMTRNTNLTNVFKILEETGGVRFQIDGKKITVMP